MEVVELAEHILKGQNLEDKLISVQEPFSFSISPKSLPSQPGRNAKLKFSNQALKFPKKGALATQQNKAIALHSFANHELLAIEMMAAALMIFPHQTQDQIKVKKLIYKNLQDEQKHFQLYVQRLSELGYEFGDFPLNDFFWKQMPNLRKWEHFLAVMALTFESANLDFASYYAEIFRDLDDHATANILDIVLKDEISHVASGAHCLHLWRGNKTLWDYYLESLPWPMTPSRSKGQHFREDLRYRCGLDQDFVVSLKNYRDDFTVTSRREWK
jgi:uncharacterized ferritin-like protein (DUF455 family)